MLRLVGICVAAYFLVGWIEFSAMLRAEPEYRPSTAKYLFGLAFWFWFPLIRCADMGWKRKDVAGRRLQRSFVILAGAAMNLGLAVFISGLLFSNMLIRSVAVVILYLVGMLPVFLMASGLHSLLAPLTARVFGTFPCKKCGRPVQGFQFDEICITCEVNEKAEVGRHIDAAIQEMDPSFGQNIPGISQEHQAMISGLERAARKEAEERMLKGLRKSEETEDD